MPTDRVALVTAASRGMGAAIARRLAADATRQQIPTGRAGSVDEVAETMAFLASEAASYVPGQSLRVDGSLTRSV